MRKRVPIVVGIVVALVVGLSACALGGDAVSRQQENLANQRKVAERFAQKREGVEQIRFTEDGGEPGLGASWSASAVVTIQGREYQLILGTLFTAGDPLPSLPPQSPRPAVRVIFSDGSSEVIPGDVMGDFVSVASRGTGPGIQVNKVEKFGPVQARVKEVGHARAQMEVAGNRMGALLALSGEPLPDVPPGTPPGEVTVVFSDGRRR